MADKIGDSAGRGGWFVSNGKAASISLHDAAFASDARRVHLLPLSEDLHVFQTAEALSDVGGRWASVRVLLPAIGDQLTEGWRPTGWYRVPKTSRYLRVSKASISKPKMLPSSTMT